MAVTIDHYDQMMFLVGVSTANKFIDLDDTTAGTFKVTLHTSTYSFDATDIQFSEVTNELATANGYTQQTEPLTSVTWLHSTGVATWDAADTVSWTASGGAIGPTSQAIIYDDTTSATNFVDALMINIQFGVDETANDTAVFNINFNASGIFTVT